MPQCQKCMNFFPPNYTNVLVDDNLQPKMMENNEPAQQCIFCQKGIDHVEIEVSKNKWEKYSKERCIQDYFRFTKKMKESGNVQDILNAEREKKFKI